LNEEIEKIILDVTYTDEFISNNYIENNEDGDHKIYEITIAKSLNGFIKYFQTGHEDRKSVV